MQSDLVENMTHWFLQNSRTFLNPPEPPKNLGKPNEIAEKISLGKLNKFKEDNSLLTQDWVMDPKLKVKDILNKIDSKSLKIKDFIRIKIGE